MKINLKKLSDQVIVITGASSGIGLATARRAARKGACLVLASRNERDLDQVVQEIRDRGGQAVAVACDVARPEDVDLVAEVARKNFGGFDTWINNAAVTIYGKLTEAHLDEKRRLFDVNFWGMVHGCRAAVRELRGRGGSIINVGSIVSERAIPLQGIYTASKHAVKGYTDSLRMELEHDGYPISVTLIKPGSIDTPYTEHARNKMVEEPSLPLPVYSPEVVARAILFCAEHPRRDVIVGGGAKVFSLMEKLSPRWTDLYMERSMFEKEPRREGHARGNYPGHVMRSSLYTAVALRPWLSIGVFGVLGVVASNWLRGSFKQPSAMRARGEVRIPVGNKGHPWNTNMDVHESGMAA